MLVFLIEFISQACLVTYVYVRIFGDPLYRCSVEVLLLNTGVRVKVRLPNISKMDWTLEEFSILQSLPDKFFHSCPCYFMWT